ncbi:MAG: phage tail assembly chaperone [Alphaproteobacteria bacterium]|nr:phage tail assembly chaperone [Alphaproteobacteria bacterium]
MSLAEWRAAIAPPRGAAPLARAELEAMMKEHPDVRP